MQRSIITITTYYVAWMQVIQPFMQGMTMKLKEQMRQRIKTQGKARATFKTYWTWSYDYMRFCRRKYGDWKHPSECNERDVTEWLTYLANVRHVSKNSQNVALQSVCYMYRELLNRPLQGISAVRAKRPQMVRDVLDQSEIAAIFAEMEGVALLVCQMMYGCGLRIGDGLGLRLKDISFERRQIIVKATKGDKWRYVSFPTVLHDAVGQQIEKVKRLHQQDSISNTGGVSLPGAYRRKSPSAATSLAWYWLFPSVSLSHDEHGVLCRHHLHASTVSRSLADAVKRAGVCKRVTSHVLRHSYATHCHENGTGLKILQTLLGHNDIRTTEIYVHADQHKATATRSPIEAILRDPHWRERQQALRVHAG